MKRIDTDIDAGRDADWSLTSADYARHRPGPPESFYARLAAHGIGLPEQDILDIATGTGHLARRFSAAGARVLGTDIAPDQIAMAAALAKADNLTAQFEVAAADAQPVAAQSQDVITASQAWVYFDTHAVFSEAARILRPGGHLVICHFSFLPRLDPIVAASEALVLDVNPDWSGKDWDGQVTPMAEADPRFDLTTFFWYDEQIPFTRESWRGRMRALRGIGASLSSADVAAFDTRHDALLRDIAEEAFTIRHRIDAQVLTLRGDV